MPSRDIASNLLRCYPKTPNPAQEGLVAGVVDGFHSDDASASSYSLTNCGNAYPSTAHKSRS